MPYVRKTFNGERARRIARTGSVRGQSIRSIPWWPEEVCSKIEKIVWAVYCTEETGEEWQEFTAYDERCWILNVRRVDGY
jgi:hypothetical protein